MTIPKAYQTEFSQSHTSNSLKREKGFFSFYQVCNRLKYYFVFVSISGAFVLCLGKIFQRIETSYQDNPTSSRTLSSNKYREKNENNSSFFASIGKFLPFKIGKDASAATNTVATAQQPVGPEFDPLAISSEDEIKILQTLANRRRDLDRREEIISKKELVITTAQNQIQEQMASLQKLKADIVEALKFTDKNERDKIIALARIYENMKPKEAARVFNQMDVKILTDIMKFMNQKKISAILGHMNVGKARELTSVIINTKSPYAASDG
jgi:flagellar motility protein MotE (MotC chaperone)